MNENDLMSRLVASKAIMDKSNTIKRGDIRQSSGFDTEVQNFDTPNVKYNIPQEFLQESQSPMNSMSTRENTKPVGIPTVDAIKNSKLPDEIKRLMIEHPIAKAEQPQMTLSNDLIERASKLMKRGDESSFTSESSKPQKTQPAAGIDYQLIQKMINEAVENALKKNGLISESTEKTNETFSFRVGKHIFEGKVTKVKKLS
jgi:hypothetical protein